MTRVVMFRLPGFLEEAQPYRKSPHGSKWLKVDLDEKRNLG
jgi:hypothetical protein